MTHTLNGLPAPITARLRRALILASIPTAFLCGYVIADDARIERQQRIDRINATHNQIANDLEEIYKQCVGLPMVKRASELMRLMRDTLYWKRCGHSWRYALYLARRTIH